MPWPDTCLCSPAVGKIASRSCMEAATVSATAPKGADGREQEMVLDLMAQLDSRVHRAEQNRGLVARAVGCQAQTQKRAPIGPINCPCLRQPSRRGKRKRSRPGRKTTIPT